jgi:hypothetical protein
MKWKAQFYQMSQLVLWNFIYGADDGLRDDAVTPVVQVADADALKVWKTCQHSYQRCTNCMLITTLWTILKLNLVLVIAITITVTSSTNLVLSHCCA